MGYEYIEVLSHLPSSGVAVVDCIVRSSAHQLRSRRLRLGWRCVSTRQCSLSQTAALLLSIRRRDQQPAIAGVLQYIWRPPMLSIMGAYREPVMRNLIPESMQERQLVLGRLGPKPGSRLAATARRMRAPQLPDEETRETAPSLVPLLLSV